MISRFVRLWARVLSRIGLSSPQAAGAVHDQIEPGPGSPFHAGELAIQKRAGTRDGAAKIGRGIHPEMAEPTRDFLRLQPMAVIASVDGEGRCWASLLSGVPGFLDARQPRLLAVSATVTDGGPLVAGLRAGAPIGLLAIDLATRRRVRVNGTVERGGGDGFELRVEQSFGNCPRYIQRRVLKATAAGVSNGGAVLSSTLSDAQRRRITEADTFLIASRHPRGGADASHRGGEPGFVRVESAHELLIPDYAGNTMFNTLGNIVTEPRVGLLFVDFATGSTLQLSGRAEILWDDPRIAQLPGAERALRVSVEQVVENATGTPLRWRLEERSPHNPPARASLS